MDKSKPGTTSLSIIDRIYRAFAERGSGRYGVEDVTQLQHALQAGQLAMQSGVAATQVTAALLHDIGHILGEADLPADLRDNLDDDHETRGYEFLKSHFGPGVADPVRLHVAAKRYLCSVNSAYEGRLSRSSLKSYHDQGGPMSDDERAAFESEPYFREAVQLRHWDDQAKDTSANPPPIEDFVTFIEQSLTINE